MKRIMLLSLIFFGLMALELPGGTVIPASAATQGILGKASALVSPVNTSLTGPSTFPGTSDPFASKSRVYKGGTYIVLATPQDVGVGDNITLSGHIYDTGGSPVSNAAIRFTINGAVLGAARSNPAGYFTHKFNNKKLPAGTYTIDANYLGSTTLERSGTSTHLTIDMGVVNVQTIPAIPGIAFQMNGKQYMSGADGSLTIPINSPGVDRLTIMVAQNNDPSQRIEFARWENGSVQTYLDIKVPSRDTNVQVGLNVFHQVGLTFVDQAKFPVDAQRVTHVTYRSAQGDVFVVKNGQPQWIPASRVARLGNGLVPTPLLYSVISVMADGSNVVNSSQQQFYALPNDTWKISMLLYSIHLSASDGLFNFPTGRSINLVAPDGTVKNYPLDLAGTAEIHSLARGNYSIQLVGAVGLGSRTPVALSRNQDVSIKEISVLDLGVLGVIGTVLTLGLLLYGRPQIFSFVMRRNRPQVIAFQKVFIEPDGENSLPIKGQVDRQNDGFIKWS
ncbi:MAG: hypothetical protein ABSG01_01450 [Anaerolineales bacterium]